MISEHLKKSKLSINVDLERSTYQPSSLNSHFTIPRYAVIKEVKKKEAFYQKIISFDTNI